MALTKATYRMINGAAFSVLDYGAVGDGTTDDTVAFQAAIDAAQLVNGIVKVPTGNYLITDTLSVYNHTQIEGETNFQYADGGFSRVSKASKIIFTATSLKSLFEYSWNSAGGNGVDPGFTFYTAITKLAITCSNSNGKYGIDVDGVIYGRFSDLSISGFETAIHCNKTINNRFENIYCNGTAIAVVYAGNSETTDVWDSCSFWGSPIGVRFEGSSVAVRFNSCLWEQIELYGMDIHSDCQSIMVTDAYSEDVPYGASPAADSCMFRVGLHTGSSLSTVSNHLIVKGGNFNGRNAGIAGQLFNVGYCWGIHASDFVANRWSYIFSTDSTNTKPNSIALGAYSGISWSNNIDDITKVSGVYPNGVLNTGSFSESARLSTVTATYSITTGAVGYYNYGGTAWISGAGSPEGAATAVVGSIWSRTDGSTGTSLYVKESGTGNTGWVAK